MENLTPSDIRSKRIVLKAVLLDKAEQKITFTFDKLLKCFIDFWMLILRRLNDNLSRVGLRSKSKRRFKICWIQNQAQKSKTKNKFRIFIDKLACVVRILVWRPKVIVSHSLTSAQTASGLRTISTAFATATKLRSMLRTEKLSFKRRIRKAICHEHRFLFLWE